MDKKKLKLIREEISVLEGRLEWWGSFTEEEQVKLVGIRQRAPEALKSKGLGWYVEGGGCQSTRTGLSALRVMEFAVLKGRLPVRKEELGLAVLAHKKLLREGSNSVTALYREFGFLELMKISRKTQTTVALRLVKAVKDQELGWKAMQSSWISHRKFYKDGCMDLEVVELYLEAGMLDAIKSAAVWSSFFVRPAEVLMAVRLARSVHNNVYLAARGNNWRDAQAKHAQSLLRQEAVGIYREAGMLEALEGGLPWGLFFGKAATTNIGTALALVRARRGTTVRHKDYVNWANHRKALLDGILSGEAISVYREAGMLESLEGGLPWGLFFGRDIEARAGRASRAVVEGIRKGVRSRKHSDAWEYHRRLFRVGKLPEAATGVYKKAGILEALKEDRTFGSFFGVDKSAKSGNTARKLAKAACAGERSRPVRGLWANHKTAYKAGTLPEEAIAIYKEAGMLWYLQRRKSWGTVAKAVQKKMKRE